MSYDLDDCGESYEPVPGKKGTIIFSCGVYVDINGEEVVVAHRNQPISSANLPFLKEMRARDRHGKPIQFPE